MQPNFSPSPEPPKHSDVKSLIFGIVSLAFFQLPLVSLVTGIVAVALSAKARQEPYSNHNVAAGGLITGIIGICLGVISTIYWCIALLGMLFLLHQEHNLTPSRPMPDFRNVPGQPAVFLLRAVLQQSLFHVSG